MKKLFAALLCIALLGLLGWRIHVKISAQKTFGAARTGAPPVSVETASVEKRTIRDVRTFTGTLQAGSTFIIAPKVGGRLKRLTVHMGDAVRQGQLIAEIEKEEHAQEVEQARAERDVVSARIEQCRTKLALAERNYRRIQNLRDNKASSQAVLDAAESDYKTTLAELKVLTAQKARMEAALRAAEIRLGYTRIHALWENGAEIRHVGERFVDEGEILSANTPILSVTDTHSLLAAVYVIEQDYPLLKKGQKAVLRTDAFPNETFDGEVLRISRILQETSRQARVEIAVPNDDLRLRPGMFVRADLEFARHDDAVVIPRQALVRHKGTPGVFRLREEDLTAHYAAVTTGIINGKWVEILSPELTGRVVTLGHHLLRDGAEVILAAP